MASRTSSPGARAVLPNVAGAALRIATCLLVLIFFQVGYYWAYRDQQGPGVLDPVTFIDRVIPLTPEFIVFYMAGYLFVLVPCLLVQPRRAFLAATVAFVVIMGIGLLVFRYFPVHMDKTLATGSDWFSRVTHFQQTIDTSYNNFPSLHVALNVYAWALIARQLGGIRPGWLLLPALIVLSTLLVKQHLLVDVAGGIALAALGYWLFAFLLRLGSARILTAYALTMAFLLGVLLTHLERLGKTWRKVERFLAAGGLSLVDLVLLLAAAGALLLALQLWRARARPAGRV